MPSVHGTMICCQWVKLFNPAGINHSRHVRNLCTGAAPECATLRGRTRNIRARPPGRPRSSLPPVNDEHVTLRYVSVPDSEENARDFPPSSRTQPPRFAEFVRIFPYFFFFFICFFFFDGWPINFRPASRCTGLIVCINNYNQQIFFPVFNPAAGVVAINHRIGIVFFGKFFVNTVA